MPELVERFFGFWCPVEERLSTLTLLREPALALQKPLQEFSCLGMISGFLAEIRPLYCHGAKDFPGSILFLQRSRLSFMFSKGSTLRSLVISLLAHRTKTPVG